jgi:hypothetical protein
MDAEFYHGCKHGNLSGSCNLCRIEEELHESKRVLSVMPKEQLDRETALTNNILKEIIVEESEPFQELLDVLDDLARREFTDERGRANSMCSTSGAEAIRLLAKHGRCRIVNDAGRLLVGEWLTAQSIPAEEDNGVTP